MPADAQDYAGCHDQLTHMGLLWPDITLGSRSRACGSPDNPPGSCEQYSAWSELMAGEYHNVSNPNKHPSPELRPVPHGTLQPTYPAEIADGHQPQSSGPYQALVSDGGGDAPGRRLVRLADAGLTIVVVIEG